MNLYPRATSVFFYSSVIIFITALNAPAQNLVVNGSAELFDSTNHAPLNWTALGGAWTSQLHSPSFADTAKDGQYFFLPGNSPDSLYQDVDVSSYAPAIDANVRSFFFLGYVQSYPQGDATTDQTRIIVQCLNSAKTSILHTFDSDTISSQSVWKAVYNTFTAPATTRYIRIMLIGTRRAGFANDAYFDAISLSTQSSGINNITGSDKIKVYPNPTVSTLTVESAEGWDFEMYDLMGKMVFKKAIVKNAQRLNIETLPTGIYMTQLTDAATGIKSVSKLEKR